jgi:hypothetical protein
MSTVSVPVSVTHKERITGRILHEFEHGELRSGRNGKGKTGSVSTRAMSGRDDRNCVYRKPKPGRSDDEVRRGWRVI